MRDFFQKEEFLALEPLGIFQFLQSLMNTGEKKDTPEPPVSDEKPQEQPKTEQNTQAIMDFLSAHEQRAKRTRKWSFSLREKWSYCIVKYVLRTSEVFSLCEKVVEIFQ